IAASTMICLRIACRPFVSCVKPVVPTDALLDARALRVLLTASMSLQTPNKRALVAGGTGRIGSAVAERLREDGWSVVAAGRADGDLRTPAGARALVERALDEHGG